MQHYLLWEKSVSTHYRCHTNMGCQVRLHVRTAGVRVWEGLPPVSGHTSVVHFDATHQICHVPPFLLSFSLSLSLTLSYFAPFVIAEISPRTTRWGNSDISSTKKTLMGHVSYNLYWSLVTWTEYIWEGEVYSKQHWIGLRATNTGTCMHKLSGSSIRFNSYLYLPLQTVHHMEK